MLDFVVFFWIDGYAILMIPSSLIAFQVIVAITGFISIVTCLMTGYLLGFHVYLSKWEINDRMKRFSFVGIDYYNLSTYDFVMNRRHNRTVDQTLSQFHQLSQNNRSDTLKTTAHRVYNCWLYSSYKKIIIFFIYLEKEG